MMWSTKDRAGYCVYPDSDKMLHCPRRRRRAAVIASARSVDYYDGEI